MPIDLDAYFERIKYEGPRQATLTTLKALHERHPCAIAFESLDPWLQRPISLEAKALEAKLVRGKRGGYCYEHNMLFWLVLDQLGFSVRGLSARVVYSTPPSGGRHPRNHMLMLVELPTEGAFIVDVGFGGLTLTAPIRLESDIIQTTPHEEIKLTRSETDYVLEADTGGVWRAMYQFGLEDYIRPDYEMANWYMSTYPGSPFVARLVAARPLPDRRLALANTAMSVHHLGGRSERHELTSAAELRTVLERDFEIELGDDPELDDKLRQLVEQAR